jgi:hypothetical protein
VQRVNVDYHACRVARAPDHPFLLIARTAEAKEIGHRGPHSQTGASLVKPLAIVLLPK